MSKEKILRQPFVVYVHANLSTVKISGQSDKFLSSISLLVCSLQVQKTDSRKQR